MLTGQITPHSSRQTFHRSADWRVVDRMEAPAEWETGCVQEVYVEGEVVEEDAGEDGEASWN